MQTFCEYLVAGQKLHDLARYIIDQSTVEMNGIELPDEYCDTSSAMPQKKNPDVAEVMAGKWSAYSNCKMALQLKNLYNKTTFPRKLEDKYSVLAKKEDLCLPCMKYVQFVYNMMEDMLKKTEFKKANVKEKIQGEFESIKFEPVNLEKLKDIRI